LLLVLILFLLIRALKMKALPSFLPSFRISGHVPTDAAAASRPRRPESSVFVFV